MPGFLNVPGYGGQATPPYAGAMPEQPAPLAESPFSILGWQPPTSLDEYMQRSAPFWGSIQDPFKMGAAGIASMFGVHPDQMPAEAEAAPPPTDIPMASSFGQDQPQSASMEFSTPFPQVPSVQLPDLSPLERMREIAETRQQATQAAIGGVPPGMSGEDIQSRFAAFAPEAMNPEALQQQRHDSVLSGIMQGMSGASQTDWGSFLAALGAGATQGRAQANALEQQQAEAEREFAMRQFELEVQINAGEIKEYWQTHDRTMAALSNEAASAASLMEAQASMMGTVNDTAFKEYAVNLDLAELSRPRIQSLAKGGTSITRTDPVAGTTTVEILPPPGVGISGSDGWEAAQEQGYQGAQQVAFSNAFNAVNNGKAMEVFGPEAMQAIAQSATENAQAMGISPMDDRYGPYVQNLIARDIMLAMMQDSRLAMAIVQGGMTPGGLGQ